MPCPEPAQQLELRVGFRGWAPISVGLGLGLPSHPPPLTCQGPARLQRLLGNRSTRTSWERPDC